MKRFRPLIAIALAGGLLVSVQGIASGGDASQQVNQPPAETAGASAVDAAPAEPPAPGVTLQLDRTSLDNGGTIVATGTAPAGKPVFIEVWSDRMVRASRFDADVDKATGKRPYVLYMTPGMPAFYRVFVPNDRAEQLEAVKKEGRKWSVSKALADLGADAAYAAPAAAPIDRYQASLLGSIVGSRGPLLPAMEEKDNRRRSMQLLKAKFRSPGKVLATGVEVAPDGTFKATLKIGSGHAPDKYFVVAAVDKATRSEPAVFENEITFPSLYFGNAGTSVNLIWPFLLALGISTFGVMMGAGGGFILNPLLVTLWPFPHTVVAGTVMPTVLFSQGSGIYNYSKIKFISWKVGVAIGLSTIAGGFLGPKLTELVSLDQYKFIFGWILLVLAALMLWQTTPGYLAKNKKEQALLKEFKRRAEEAAQGVEKPGETKAA
jgi:uncharacterized protein